MDARKQGITLFSATCFLVGMLVVIQLWLLSASMDELFAGDASSSARAAVASTVLFVANFGLVRYVLGFDRRLRRAIGD